MWFNYKNAFEMACNYEKQNSFEYDFFMTFRSDIIIDKISNTDQEKWNLEELYDLINAFKNLTPSCEINDIKLIKYPYPGIDMYLQHIYTTLHIYASYFSKDMLSMIPHRLDISFVTYRYIFETFNELFRDLKSGEVSYIKSTLSKCISNIDRIGKPVHVDIFPNMEKPTYVFDESLSISKIPPLFHTIMNEMQQKTIDRLKPQKAKPIATPEVEKDICHARDDIINVYVANLIDNSIRELDELVQRKEPNILFIKKIILIFYDLIFTSRPPYNYIFNMSISSRSTEFKQAMLELLIIIKDNLPKDDMYLMYNQLYAFLSIYFPLEDREKKDLEPTFIRTSNYIFEHDL
jgi:hypothetical protein